jgi:hypothetical protein
MLPRNMEPDARPPHSTRRVSRSVGTGFDELDERIDYFIKFAPRQNFGDYLPEIICKELLGYPRIDADMFRLVGSVIDERWIRRDLGRHNGHVAGLIAFWCCGARGPAALSPAIAAHCRFFGVRGPLTRDALELPRDTVMGDPGLLAPLFHQPSRHAATAGKAIAIPHIHDGRPQDRLLALSGAEVLVHPEVEASERAMRDILDRIASADFVLTASLHGAIIAAAYRRPFAFWDNGHLDVAFKWSDFAGSVGIEARFAANLDEGRRLHAEQALLIRLPRLTPILDICPFQPKPAALLRALAHDGAGNAETLLAAAAIIDEAALPSEAMLAAIQRDSAANRRSRTHLARLAKGAAGRGARKLKQRLHRLISRDRRPVP